MPQEPGTTGLVSSLGFIPGAIRLATRSHTSHIVTATGDGTVLEALGGGVAENPESDYDHADIIWLKNLPLTLEQRKRSVAYGREFVGWDYNYPAIGVFGLRFFGLPHQWAAKRADALRALICSEYQLKMWRHVGFDPWPAPEFKYACTIAPADFANAALRHDWA